MSILVIVALWLVIHGIFFTFLSWILYKVFVGPGKKVTQPAYSKHKTDNKLDYH